MHGGAKDTGLYDTYKKLSAMAKKLVKEKKLILAADKFTESGPRGSHETYMEPRYSLP
jgi:hypothetical protein